MLNKKLRFFILPLIITLSSYAEDPFFNDPFGDDIFKEMMQMQEDMSKMFDKMHNRMQQRSSRLVSPLGTYKVSGEHQFVDKGIYYELVTNIPENKENQIDLNIKDGVLSITAKIIEKHENKNANGFSSSSSMQMYQQSMPIPKDADEGTLKAEYRNKKLVISINKKETNTQKAIPNKNKQTPLEENTTDSNHTKETTNSFKKRTINSDIPSMT
jgi:HSP20 family molecular chaperone IbpA